MKVLYFINYAPNYRDVFLKELGKHIDLTVVSYEGKEANLKDPEKREGYKYIGLKRKRFLKINFNTKEFTLANGDYDVIIVGYTLWNPFRMMNLFRKKKRVIAEGLIYGKSNNLITKFLRRWYLNAAEGVLVYSQMVKKRLEKEIDKDIIVFNNTSFSKNEIQPIEHNTIDKRLNILWVGRYQPRKKIERLIELAKRNNKVNIRLIGPDLKMLFSESKPENLEILDAVYSNELRPHFEWTNVIFNPGGAGLLVMNTARFSRPIIIDKYGHHGPEVQLALDAKQEFIDFADVNEVDNIVDKCLKNEKYLVSQGEKMALKMKNYTIEYMAEQYLKAIKGEWN